jgi:hypothetical protein
VYDLVGLILGDIEPRDTMPFSLEELREVADQRQAYTEKVNGLLSTAQMENARLRKALADLFKLVAALDEEAARSRGGI